LIRTAATDGLNFTHTAGGGQIVIIAQTDNPKADEHRKYARFAAYCLSQGNGASDPDARDMQRRMALEWLKLADAMLHPAQPPK
jgi:hypothetical protein